MHKNLNIVFIFGQVANSGKVTELDDGLTKVREGLRSLRPVERPRSWGRGRGELG